MDSSDDKLNRREFLQRGALVAAGSAALSNTALSYTRISGRTTGSRWGISHWQSCAELDGIGGAQRNKNTEVTAVCDL